jgi:hypothetical protein
MRNMSQGLRDAAGPQQLSTTISPADVLALQSEADVTKTILGFLKAELWRCYRLQSGKVRGLSGGRPIKLNEKGTPDWIAIRPFFPDSKTAGCMSQAFYLEVKRPGGKVRPAQAAMHIALRQDGFTVLVADSYNAFIREYKASFE